MSDINKGAQQFEPLAAQNPISAINDPPKHIGILHHRHKHSTKYIYILPNPWSLDFLYL